MLVYQRVFFCYFDVCRKNPLVCCISRNSNQTGDFWWAIFHVFSKNEGLIFLERIRSKLAFISQMWVISWSWELLQILKLKEDLPRCIWLDVYFLCYLMVYVIIYVLWIPMSPNCPSQLSFDFARRVGIWFKILRRGLLRLQCALFAVSTMIKHKIS